MNMSASRVRSVRQLSPPLHRQRSWNDGSALVGELIYEVAPRASFALIGGALIGGVLAALGLSNLGMIETFVAASFWTAALMTATFRGNVGRMLFWVLLIDASLLIYQVSIHQFVLDEYKIVRLGPPVLAAGLLLLTGSSRTTGHRFVYITWILCNLPALFSGLTNEYLSLADTIVVVAFNTLYPLAIYYAVQCETHADERAFDRISLSAIVLCIAPTALMPVELAARDSSSFASLQFGGRAYSVIGALYLLWPILVTRLTVWRPKLRALSIGAILLVFATSFSRGAMLSLFLMLTGTVIFAGKSRGKLVSGVLATGLVLLGIGSVLFQERLGEGVWFWLLRMNVASNLSNHMIFDVQEFLLTDRDSIWQLAVTFFGWSPLWGHGIGSTPVLLDTVTSGRIAFSGMHNFFLTVLV